MLKMTLIVVFVFAFVRVGIAVFVGVFVNGTLPPKPKVEAHGQMVACSALVAHAVVGAVWAAASIERFRLGKEFGCEVTGSLRCEVQCRGVGVQEGRGQVDMVNLLPLALVAVAATEATGDARHVCPLGERA